MEPVTAAMAPKAPSGAAHMTIARMRKTSRCMCSMPRSTGCPADPIACRAKPVRSATSRVCRTWPSVNAETMVVGMIESTKSTGGSASADTWPWPASLTASVIARLLPGSRMLPTTRPMASATRDITRK